jgi:hypothetical protein
MGLDGSRHLRMGEVQLGRMWHGGDPSDMEIC